MFESITTSLKQWNKQNSERVKLQHVYAVTALILLVAAGLVGLLSDIASQQLLAVVFGLVVLFFANAVVWALLDSFVLQRLAKTRTTRKN